MKLFITLLLLLIPLIGFGEEKEGKIDPVGGREIIELDEDKAYIITSGDWKYQIELTIDKNGYGIAQLSNDGTGVPPIVIISEDGKIQTIRSFPSKEGKIEKEIVINDEDGDGLPESRMTLERVDGSTKKIKMEELSIKSTIKIERTFDANQSGGDNSE
jgi:hypothetical protein